MIESAELSWNQLKEALDRQREAQKSDSAGFNALQFYENHQEMFTASLKYYNGYIDHKELYTSDPAALPHDERERLKSLPVVLVITATDMEQGVFLRYMTEQNGAPLPTYWINSRLYQMFPQEKYTLVHVNAQKTGDEYVRRAINHAYRNLPKGSIRYLFLLGICYGMDFRQQQLGDVVVSDEIWGYRINFRDENGGTQFVPERLFTEHPNEALTQKIADYLRLRQPSAFTSSGETRKISAKPGKFLSSDCLMSSRQVKQAVVNTMGDTKPKALGGEMEACGIFKSILFETGKFDNWLVVKSICDWGEDKNSLCPNDPDKGERIKDAFQAHAMINSCETLGALLKKVIF